MIQLILCVHEKKNLRALAIFSCILIFNLLKHLILHKFQEKYSSSYKLNKKDQVIYFYIDHKTKAINRDVLLLVILSGKKTGCFEIPLGYNQ